MLEREEDGSRTILRARHLVGRSSLAHLRLTDPSVSAEHATFSWAGSAWELHDLGSRNGTFLEGRRLTFGERAMLVAGARVTFGAAGEAFRLVDDAPPAPMARALPGGDWVVGDHDMLAIPDAEHPAVTVYRNAENAWVLERDGGTEPVEDRAEIEAAGRRFELHIPDVVKPTWESQGGARLSLPDLRLRFFVSRDEELASLRVAGGPEELDLGERAHHLLLLALARARIRDQADTKGSLPESSCGWVYLDDLSKDLDMDEMHVNVAIHRARRQLAGAGVLRAAEIVQRRKATRQLRIGVAKLEVTVL